METTTDRDSAISSRSQPPISEDSQRKRAKALWTPDFVPWKSELRPEFLEGWEATGNTAQHISIIGVTGSGKTTLTLDLLTGKLNQDRDARVIMLLNKRRDDTMRGLVDSGRIACIRDWDELAYKHRVKRLIALWPTYPRNASESAKVNGPIFQEALNRIMEEGDWIVYVDETQYMIEQLHLRTLFDEYWNSARSNGISVVAGGQRPVWVSRSMTSQHSWFFTFKIKDLRDRIIVGESVGDRRNVPAAIGELKRHYFLVLQTDEDTGYVSNVRS